MIENILLTERQPLNTKLSEATNFIALIEWQNLLEYKNGNDISKINQIFINSINYN